MVKFSSASHVLDDVHGINAKWWCLQNSPMCPRLIYTVKKCNVPHAVLFSKSCSAMSTASMLNLDVCKTDYALNLSMIYTVKKCHVPCHNVFNKLTSFDIFVHKLFMEFWSESVIDKFLFLLVIFTTSAIFEHNVIIPSVNKENNVETNTKIKIKCFKTFWAKESYYTLLTLK